MCAPTLYPGMPDRGTIHQLTNLKLLPEVCPDIIPKETESIITIICPPPSGLVPKLFETFMAVCALARFAECSLLLWKVSTNGRKWAKQVRNQAQASNLCLISRVNFISFS